VTGKQRVVSLIQRYALNPPARLVAGMLPGWALVETTGRRTGRRRRTPVGCRRRGTTVWIVSEHGLRSGWVSNLQADPRVRVRVGGRWRSGTATLMPQDDPRRRLRSINPVNAAFTWLLGTNLLTVKIELGT
jgi:deazaflavin-dependent oxidoreductase (nitroreductase family)